VLLLALSIASERKRTSALFQFIVKTSVNTSFNRSLSATQSAYRTSRLFDLTAPLPEGGEQPLRAYEGQVLLVVNTASQCGLTSQYKGLQALQDKYGPKGFTILAFPSADFLGQEFASDESIQSFCKGNYGTTFPVFGKVNVRGRKQHPVFQHLTNQRKGWVKAPQPYWNFQKYLVDRKGNLVDFWFPFVSPLSPRVIQRIENTL
jgi:glutathione peroxidase